MKKIRICIAITSASVVNLSASLFGQPVITSSSSLLPVGTVDSVYGAPATVPPGAGGAGVTWNLSGLSLTLGGTLTVVNPSASPYISTFPTSNFCFQLIIGSTDYNYNKKSATGMETIATSYAGTGTGVDYSPNPRLSVPFPFHYNDAVVDTYQTTTGGPQVETLTYDGYGTLVTPLHTYTNVIRVKEDYGGTDFHYAWYTVSPLMLILDYSNTANNYVYISEFPTPSAAQAIGAPGVSALLFPNPFSETATFLIDLPGGPQQARLVLSDASGRVVRELHLSGTATTISKDGLTSGIYFYQVYNGGQRVANGKLVIQ